MSKKQKLELTWIGKDERPKLEPRILIEDPELSHHADKRYGENDIFDNILIQGDNLLALKALEQEYAGKVKCIYIDPPYNTGSAFEHYDDGLEHSIWLGLLRDRLEILKNFLTDDGSIWVNIDDNEVHYLKVLMDEIFGRRNFIVNNVWQKRYSRDGRGVIGDAHEHILCYARNPDLLKQSRNLLPLGEKQTKLYKNPDNDPRGPWQSVSLLAQGYRPNQMYEIEAPNGSIHRPKKGACWKVVEETLAQLIADDRITFGTDGTGVPRRKYFLSEAEGMVPWSWWPHEEVGHTGESKSEIQKLFGSLIFDTPKPERLLNRIIHIATSPGDVVLDSFGGSGTTAAVAHKMGRKWIMVELGDHAQTHIVPRLNKVIDGEDQGGVTEATGWKGGGGYRFYRLAPSLLEKDPYGNWVISKEYDANKLSEAICKLMGFTYDPSDKDYWNHGYSTESDFIFVTTNAMTYDALKALSAEVGAGRSLMVCCKAFNADPDAFDNLTLKKIPHAVVDQCEWGKDDYSLNVQNLPMFEDEESDEELDLFNALEGDDA